jgi:CheY-like chemotaxis protein
MAKILLVEDDDNLREIYEARLAAEGYTIASAHDGEEALVVAKAQKPDLVISDVMMPKISGFEMLDILRNTDGLKDVKVIMLTALGQSEDQQRADRLGADRYLVKSQVTLEDIVKVAQDLLDGGTVGLPPNPSFAPAADMVAAPAPPPVAVPVPEPVAPAPAPTPTPVIPEPPAPTPVPVVPEPVPAPVLEPLPQLVPPPPVAVPVPEPVAPAPAPTPTPVIPEPPAPTPVPVVPEPVPAPVLEPLPQLVPPPPVAVPVPEPIPEPEVMPEPLAEPTPEPVAIPEPAPAPSLPLSDPITADASAVPRNNSIALTAQDEAASVEAQIEDFVTGATSDPNPPSRSETAVAASSSTPTVNIGTVPPEPVAPVETSLTGPPQVITPEQAAKTLNTADENNDKLMSDAVDNLVAGASGPSPILEHNTINVPQPTPEPQSSRLPEGSPGPAIVGEEKPDLMQRVAGKKLVIEPIKTDPKPDLNTLLALEASKDQIPGQVLSSPQPLQDPGAQSAQQPFDPNSIAL